MTDVDTGITNDSLTFGQLKKIVAQQRTRPREVQYAFEFEDHESLAEELDEWYDEAQEETLIRCLACFDQDFAHSHPWSKMSVEDKYICIDQYLAELTQDGAQVNGNSAACLSYIAQGCYAEASSKDHQLVYVKENALMLQQRNSWSKLARCLRISVDKLDSCTTETLVDEFMRTIVDIMTTLYFMLEATDVRKEIQEDGLIEYLIELLAKMNDETEHHLRPIPVRQACQLLWKCILQCLGGQKELNASKLHSRQRAGLNPKKNDMTTTPLEYAIYRSELISKYPSYDPPQILKHEYHTLPQAKPVEQPAFIDGHWTATPAPSPPPSPKGKKSLYTTDQAMPFVLPPGPTIVDSVPVSIEEAAKLFESRQRTTMSMLQIWQEQQGIDSEDLLDESVEAERLRFIERVYANTVPHLSGLVSCITGHLWNVSSRTIPANANLEKEMETRMEESVAATKQWLFNDKTNDGTSHQEMEDTRELEITARASSSLLLSLLKWFRANHILKFEYLSQLIFDADWLQTLHQTLLSLNPVVTAQEPNDTEIYFRLCATIAGRSDSPPSRPKPARTDPNMMTKYNKRVLTSVKNLLHITHKITVRKQYRCSIMVQSKTWLHLRRPLKIPHPTISQLTLKLFKSQVPLCSRKWRMGNMRVITQIYMSCKPQFRDDWIAGADGDYDPTEARLQEDAIRTLVEQYHLRRYRCALEDAGVIDDIDFFELELERMGI